MFDSDSGKMPFEYADCTRIVCKSPSIFDDCWQYQPKQPKVSSLNFLHNPNRERHKAKNKNYQRQDGDDFSGEIERRVVERFGMFNSQHHGEQNGEQKSARTVVEKPAEQGNHRHCSERDSARPKMKPFAENRINGVSAVELPGRNQIQAGHQHSDPSRREKRIKFTEIRVNA